MPEDIQEHMCALIAQHGNALAALAAFWQQPEVHQNDKQTESLENHVPHNINVPIDLIWVYRQIHTHLCIRHGVQTSHLERTINWFGSKNEVDGLKNQDVS
jgi:hypothetical protein